MDRYRSMRCVNRLKRSDESRLCWTVYRQWPSYGNGHWGAVYGIRQCKNWRTFLALNTTQTCLDKGFAVWFYTPMTKTRKLSLFQRRQALLSAMRLDLMERETRALAQLDPADRDMARVMSDENAHDKMIEHGAHNFRCGSFAYRRAYINTLELIADCAPEYGLRRVGGE